MSEQANPTNGHVDLAAYLMDLLTPEQRARADGHLRGCTECRDEVESLSEWSAALSAMPEEMLLDGPPDGGDLLLQRTLRQVRSESKRKVSRRTAMSAVAAAVALVVAITGGALIGRGTAPSAPTAAASASVPAGAETVSAVDPMTGARIKATVVPAAGWVRVNVTVSGVAAGERCRLEVMAKDGTSVLAGGWVVSAAGAANGTTVMGSALIDPGQVAQIWVENEEGDKYVSVNL